MAVTYKDVRQMSVTTWPSEQRTYDVAGATVVAGNGSAFCDSCGSNMCEHTNAVRAFRARPQVQQSTQVLPDPMTDYAGVRWGWLDREGRLYPCHYGGHRGLANLLRVDRGLTRPPPRMSDWRPGDDEVSDDEQAVEAAGYIRLTSATGWRGPSEWLNLDDMKRPTERQRSAIMEWCTANGAKLPRWWDDEGAF